MTLCPECGGSLAESVTAGLCSKCLILEGFKLATAIVPPDAAPASDNSIRQLGDYELLEEIARGGMGVIYRARQRSLDRIVAVKLLLFGVQASPEYVKRFRAEASTAASLQHPNIVAIHEVGVHQGEQYLVMDLVDGPNLAKFIKDQPLSAKRAAGYLKTIAEAIHYAHERGILHRDLKPSNVLIDSNDQPRVTDFGLARRLDGDSSLTLTGQMLGSPSYMPPEQAGAGRHKLGRSSDVYSLGAMLYHMLAGRPPFVGEALNQTLDQVFNQEPISPRLLNPAVPRDLETICLKCLEKEPARRYPSAQALADELGRFLNDEPIHARPVSPPEKLWRWCRRKPALAVSVGVSLGLLLLVAIGSPIAVLRVSAARSASEKELYVANIHQANEALGAHDLAQTRLLLHEIDKSSIQRAQRGWEWRYLAGRSRGDELATLYRHKTLLSGIATSPDGKWLAAIGEDGKVLLWDFLARKESSRWSAHTSGSQSQAEVTRHDLVFAPDSSTLITTGTDKNIRLWEVPSGHLRAEVPLPDAASRLAISQNGGMLVAGTAGGQLSLFSLATGRPALLYTGACDVVLIDLRLSPDGLALFVGGADAQVVLRYDLSDLRHPRRLPDLDDSTGPLAVSPDGRWLATARSDGQSVCVRALPSLTPVATNSEALGESQVNVVAFSPDSRVLALGLKSGRIILWEIGKPAVESVTLLGHEGALARLAFSRDGRTLASAGYSDKTVRLWDATLREQGRWTFREEGDARDVNFSGDSKHLVSVSRATAASGTNRPETVFIVKLWAVDERQGLIPMAAVTNSSKLGLNFCARFSADAATIAVDDYQTLRFLEVPTLRLLAQAGQRRPCFARDGRWLLYVEEDRILRSDSPLKPATVVARQTGVVTALAMSPDGAVVASCAQNEDHAIKLWDTVTGRLLGSLPGHEAWVNDLAFSPDRKTLASAGWDDGWLGIWDVPHRRRRALLRGHNGAVFKVAFSPDGATVATCGDDATVRLWNVAQQREVAVLPARGGSVKGMAFSPDGHWLASASNDGTIRLWHAPSFAEIEAAARVTGGNGQ